MNMAIDGFTERPAPSHAEPRRRPMRRLAKTAGKPRFRRSDVARSKTSGTPFAQASPQHPLLKLWEAHAIPMSVGVFLLWFFATNWRGVAAAGAAALDLIGI